MPYIPPPEKLQALGFVFSHRRAEVGEIYHSPDESRVIFLLDTGWVEMQQGLVVHAKPYPVFVGQLTSEAFFDELITAVGWTR